uniref:Uncharacterized protein n=1 Tax=Arundo donax TaxID=35708 RepID=A0A0A9E0X9_ARUDO
MKPASYFCQIKTALVKGLSSLDTSPQVHTPAA